MAEARPAYTTAKNDVKSPQRRIPAQTEAPFWKAIGVMYRTGKMPPIFRTVYANAEYGDMTRTRPDARRVNTWTCAVACAPRLAKTSTSPTGLAPAPAPVTVVLTSRFCRAISESPITHRAHPYTDLAIRAKRVGSGEPPNVCRCARPRRPPASPRATMPNEPSFVALGEDDFLREARSIVDAAQAQGTALRILGSR